MGSVYSAAEKAVTGGRPEKVSLLHNDSGVRWRSRAAMWMCVAVAVLALVAGVVYGAVSYTASSASSQADRALVQDLFFDLPDSGETGRFRQAAVAADNQQCSTIGKDMLVQGGSAVDSAIAAMLCVGIHNMQSTGIGGGHFMLIYESPKEGGPKELVALDSREVAPLAADRDMYKDDSSGSYQGGKAVGVPGEVMGFYTAWKKFGRLSWKSLVLPTVRMCEDGFRVGKPLAKTLAGREDMIKEDPAWSKNFIKEDGQLVQEGDILRLPDLARTLRLVAEGGADVFYNGPLTDDIVADITDTGGILTSADLQHYSVIWREPTVTHLNRPELTVYGFPPPGSGPVLQYILAILDGYNLDAESLESEDSSVLTYHRLVESLKFAFARRSYLADPAFEDMSQLVSNLTSREYARQTRERIDDDKTHDWKYYESAYDVVSDHGTSHLSVLTTGGSAVALTSTINTGLGSKVRGKRTGIIFNNEMDDFAKPTDVSQWGIPPSKANYIVPGKRPTSSMCPTIVLGKDGQVQLVLGGAGGSKITSTVAFVSAHALWLGMQVDEAMSTPRLHHQLLPPEIKFESKFPKAVLRGLKAKGHNITETDSIAVVQAIDNTCVGQDNRPGSQTHIPKVFLPCLLASCDTRKGGAPDGF